MNKETLILLLLILLLLAGMIFTLLAGDNRSRHGYGISPPQSTEYRPLSA